MLRSVVTKIISADRDVGATSPAGSPSSRKYRPRGGDLPVPRGELRPLVRLLRETGLRLGEACNLRWGDVDWTAGVATLRKTKAGKTQYAPLSAETLAILRALGPGEGAGPCFWRDGRPWTRGYVTHAFRDAVEDAAIADLHVHDLRHTFACRRLRGGVDIYTVSKLLRHASVIMSERYAHLSQTDLNAAVERSREAQ